MEIIEPHIRMIRKLVRNYEWLSGREGVEEAALENWERLGTHLSVIPRQCYGDKGKFNWYVATVIGAHQELQRNLWLDDERRCLSEVYTQALGEGNLGRAIRANRLLREHAYEEIDSLMDVMGKITNGRARASREVIEEEVRRGKGLMDKLERDLEDWEKEHESLVYNKNVRGGK